MGLIGISSSTDIIPDASRYQQNTWWSFCGGTVDLLGNVAHGNNRDTLADRPAKINLGKVRGKTGQETKPSPMDGRRKEPQ